MERGEGKSGGEERRKKLPKRVVETEGGPPAVGPYSKAVRAGGWLYLSGQLPVDPESGELVSGPPAAAAERALENLKAVLEGCGASLADVVKVTIYLARMADFSEVNEVYSRYFPGEPPARACVGVAELPLGAPLEMELVAYVGG